MYIAGIFPLSVIVIIVSVTLLISVTSVTYKLRIKTLGTSLCTHIFYKNFAWME
jgi:hypothetical protein